MPRRVASHSVAPLTTPAARPLAASSPAPAETRRAWAPKPAARATPRHVDGNAYCARALADIRARTARGEKVTVVFDIDNTLSDGRTRTLAVGQAWDKLNGTSFFSGVAKERIGHDAVDTAATLKIPADKREAWKTFWEREFWAPHSFVHDAPIADAVALVKAAKAAGAEVTYLTGRIAELEPATIAQLRRFGLPDVDGDHVVTKPDLSVKTTAWRTGWLAQQPPGSIGLFFTESRRDLGDAQAKVAGLPAVLLQSPFGGDHAIRSETPIFRARG